MARPAGRPLRRLGAAMALLVAAGAFILALAALAVLSAAVGGPLLVQFALLLEGR